jgi:NAD(P)-dependent dehydrogenase (short-subunit alcohol dehydrogenase family)
VQVKGSAVVVTGAASGLGEGTVRYLAARGARAVVRLEVDEVRGRSVVESVGATCSFTAVDISEESRAAFMGGNLARVMRWE